MSILLPSDFKHRCVQDLAWVIYSPSLMIGNSHGDYCNSRWLDDAWWQTEYQACLPALIALDNDPEPLIQALANRKTQRLGEHFECLVNYWLNISPNYRCLLQNYVLYQPNHKHRKTLGELDFIIQQQTTGKIIHLEVAAKFYLARTNGQQLDDWYGANLNDLFSRKVAHIHQHQSQLAHHYADLLPYTIDESWIMLKGRLFYPHGLITNSTLTSQSQNNVYNQLQYNNDYALNPLHLKGYWYKQQCIKDWTDLRRLPKHAWFAPLNEPLLESYRQQSLPARLSSPQAECWLDTSKSITQEQRLFVVPDHHWARLIE
jgi:hypothetical protein